MNVSCKCGEDDEWFLQASTEKAVYQITLTAPCSVVKFDLNPDRGEVKKSTDSKVSSPQKYNSPASALEAIEKSEKATDEPKD